MPTQTAPPGDPAAAAGRHAAFSARVEAALRDFLDRAQGTLESVGPELALVSVATRDFVLAGGKRLRPAFCYWGWRGAGAPDSGSLVAAAASLELLHACALIHDDVMDGSDTRRGRPAIHREFAQAHTASGWAGDPDGFGASAAILIGDLCLVWADQMLRESGLDEAAIRRAAGVYAEMRVELMAGQYLDVLASVLDEPDAAAATDRAVRVARYKSAKYTIERPLHLGGVLAGAAAPLLAVYSAYGLPLGEAFQLRDDVLGVYGDPAVTGKPAGDDLREGKRTLLVSIAEQRATAAQRQSLAGLVGDPDLDGEGVTACQHIIAECGALDQVESLIARRAAEATGALSEAAIDETARQALTSLAAAATNRVG